MGRKSSSKQHRTDSGSTPSGEGRSGFSPLLLGVILVAVLGIGVLAFWRGNGSSTNAAAVDSTPAAAPASAREVPPEIVASTAKTASLGPHKQAKLPPIPFRGYEAPRAPEVVRAAFEFAAEHPEVLSYVPCFCGCENGGHRGNHDCFVKSRATNGDVIEWEEHGIECAVCIDVATRSRQMYASGASLQDIRAAVEKEFTPNFPSMTPTPKAPAHNH